MASANRPASSRVLLHHIGQASAGQVFQDGVQTLQEGPEFGAPVLGQSPHPPEAGEVLLADATSQQLVGGPDALGKRRGSGHQGAASRFGLRGQPWCIT